MPILNFKGRSIIYSHHLSVPFHPLKIDKNKSLPKEGPSLEDNLIIHGDNLHALKALMPRYAGRIKCIYIDPPYNTGNENWVFNDNMNSPIIEEWLGKEVGIEDLEKHDKWLCMIWPRLQLLKDLLTDDGVICISIDDNEQRHLQLIMDEIFGEDNHLATIVKPTKIGGGSNTKHIVKSHEYILIYAKDKELLHPIFVKHDQKYLDRYKEKDKKGSFFWDTLNRPGLNGQKYDIKAPDGTNITGYWIRSKDRVQKDILSGEIKFEKVRSKWSVQFKQRLNEQGKKLRSLLSQDVVGGTIEGSQELSDFNIEFPYPKSSRMIKYLLESLSSPNAIILDSFAGSGTTAQAVLDLNKEDGGNRKFILVECEDYADRITAERVRRVIKGVSTAKDEKLQKGLGGSFTYCTLDKELNEENFLKGKSLPSYNILARYIFHTATGETLKNLSENKDFYIGKTRQNIAVFVVYKPDKNFLRSNDSALHLNRQSKILKVMQSENCKKVYVFAMACFIPQEELLKNNIVFCQIPFAIHRLAGS